MTERQFQISVIAIGGAFTLLFCFLVIPPLIQQPNIIEAFAMGFVNPYAAGYSADVIACWAILAVWVVYEAKVEGIRNGWLCLLVGIVPGVVVGFAAYLVLRLAQTTTASRRSCS